MNNHQELIKNIEKIKTTDLGIQRIQRNLSLETHDVVDICKQFIRDEKSVILKKGKNWYVHYEDIILTINASSYTIITAHKKKSTIY